MSASDSYSGAIDRAQSVIAGANLSLAVREEPDIMIIGQLGFLRTHDRLYVRLLAPGKPLGRKVLG